MLGFRDVLVSLWATMQQSPRLAATAMVASLLVFRVLVVSVYRLFFSPLAKFPGPKLAAATGLYETYFNLVKNGKYVFEIERLHKVYGAFVIRAST
jgi:hypothetical protein